jgi:cellulose biosynthesis protein BcsQ
MILTVGNTKGGVGKTTIAVNAAMVRAAAGRDVLLIDGDEQQTAITFTELRGVQLGQPGYTAGEFARQRDPDAGPPACSEVRRYHHRCWRQGYRQLARCPHHQRNISDSGPAVQL